MQAIAAAAAAKGLFLRPRIHSVSGVVLPVQAPAEDVALLFYSNLLRTRSTVMAVGQVFLVPVDLPADEVIHTFVQFVALTNFIVLRVIGLLPQSITVQFVGTTDGVPANMEPVIAILGPTGSTLTVPRPPFYLQVLGALQTEIAPPPVVVQQLVIPAVPAAPVGPPAVVPPVLMRITEEEDFKDLERTKGLFDSQLQYTNLFYIVPEGAAPTGKNISWSHAYDVISAALSNNNRFATKGSVVQLSKTEIKQFCTKDFRHNNLSISSFVISGSGHETIFIALERLAILERTVTGNDLHAAIMHLRQGARDYYANHPRMPDELVAESLNAHLDKLRSSPTTDPNVAHVQTLAERLRVLLTFDPTDPTVSGALSSETYLAALMRSAEVTGAGIRGGDRGGRGGGRSSGRDGATSKRKDGDTASLRDWLDKAPPTLKGERICYDWLQKTGACADAVHHSKCRSGKVTRDGQPFLHRYPPGLSNSQYTDIDDWAKGQSPKRHKK